MAQLLLAIIYLSFISLGLPDALLGAAWPSMYGAFDVPLSYAGIISAIIAAGTVLSSLQSDRLTRRLGTGPVTAISVAVTALALFGFSISHSFWLLCLWAVPYGLGAGSVDASLNNYVALHYASRHMSWLHCMWGVGASVGPYILSAALLRGRGWNAGYRSIALLQVGLTALLLLSLPCWKRQTAAGEAPAAALSLKQLTAISGVKEVMAAFFCYCALEQTAGLWAGSYLVLVKNFSAERAAGFSALFFLGITAGRALSGFATFRFNDAQMVRLGEGILLLGCGVLVLPLGTACALIGLGLIGLGCAPVYPSLIHATPRHFGAHRSQAVIGVQMASAYVGTCFMPPLFGILSRALSPALLPLYLFLLLLGMAVSHERLVRKSLWSSQ